MGSGELIEEESSKDPNPFVESSSNPGSQSFSVRDSRGQSTISSLTNPPSLNSSQNKSYLSANRNDLSSKTRSSVIIPPVEEDSDKIDKIQTEKLEPEIEIEENLEDTLEEDEIKYSKNLNEEDEYELDKFDVEERTMPKNKGSNNEDKGTQHNISIHKIQDSFRKARQRKLQKKNLRHNSIEIKETEWDNFILEGPKEKAESIFKIMDDRRKMNLTGTERRKFRPRSAPSILSLMKNPPSKKSYYDCDRPAVSEFNTLGAKGAMDRVRIISSNTHEYIRAIAENKLELYESKIQSAVERNKEEFKEKKRQIWREFVTKKRPLSADMLKWKKLEKVGLNPTKKSDRDIDLTMVYREMYKQKEIEDKQKKTELLIKKKEMKQKSRVELQGEKAAIEDRGRSIASELLKRREQLYRALDNRRVATENKIRRADKFASSKYILQARPWLAESAAQDRASALLSSSLFATKVDKVLKNLEMKDPLYSKKRPASAKVLSESSTSWSRTGKTNSSMKGDLNKSMNRARPKSAHARLATNLARGENNTTDVKSQSNSKEHFSVENKRPKKKKFKRKKKSLPPGHIECGFCKKAHQKELSIIPPYKCLTYPDATFCSYECTRSFAYKFLPFAKRAVAGTQIDIMAGRIVNIAPYGAHKLS